MIHLCVLVDRYARDVIYFVLLTVLAVFNMTISAYELVCLRRVAGV